MTVPVALGMKISIWPGVLFVGVCKVLVLVVDPLQKVLVVLKPVLLGSSSITNPTFVPLGCDTVVKLVVWPL